MPTFAILASLVLAVGAPSYASFGFVVAQGDAEDAETEGETGGGEGESDPEAETESGAEGSEPAEAGPPWTYQMARIGLVLLVFLALSIGMAYYRFVASRRRRAA